MDPGFSGHNFTWKRERGDSDKAKKTTIWERLDKFLINSEMQSICKAFKVQHLGFFSSYRRMIKADVFFCHLVIIIVVVLLCISIVPGLISTIPRI